MIVEGCRVNLRDRRDEETCEIPRLKSPILRRIYEPLSQRARKFSTPKTQENPISNDTVKMKSTEKIPRRSRRISRPLKMPKNQLPRELLQIPSLPFPRFGVNLCPGRGRQTLCQQFNNEILSEQLQKVKSAQSVEDFRKLLERIHSEETPKKRLPNNDHGDFESHQDILVPQRRNNIRGPREKYQKPRGRISEEEGKHIEEWITKLAVNCHDEGFEAHLKFLDECTTRLSKKELHPCCDTTPASVKSDSGRRSYRISVKINGSHVTHSEYRDADLVESFTRLDISRGNAPLPQIVLNDDFTSIVDIAHAEHLTSSRHIELSPDVGGSLKSPGIPTLLKIAEERPRHTRKFSR